MQPVARPPARLYPGLAYDAAADRIILFGGAVGGSRLCDTWAYDYNTNTWTTLDPATSPSPRGSPGMVYDPDAAAMILFSGVGPAAEGDIFYDETWTYSYASNSWTRRSTAVSPDPRARHAMVYAATSDRTVLFGGGPDRPTFVQETWTCVSAANAWALVDPPSSQPGPGFPWTIIAGSIAGAAAVASVAMAFLRRRKQQV